MSRVVSPDNTNTESIAKFLAINISVYNLSPIISISDLSIFSSLATSSTILISGFPKIFNGATFVVISSIWIKDPISGIGPNSVGQNISL
uniref:Uncharacterized protein n=1 Tax=Glaesserella parasuis TaxID=738 RepID=T1RQ59_GLAPU|nr:hypothetical protein [Glaesserella parasuis]AGM38644.1 hypothetical protein [Glaesserella parasuis]AGM38805.1 hypothetical protein [Glaesserella parasuis]